MTLIEIFNEYTEIIIISVVLTIYFILDVYLRRKNKKLKKALYEKYNVIDNDGKNVSDIQNIDEEDQLTYYKNKNFISLIRFWVGFFLLSFYILHKLPNFFSFFAIAVWAIIITFKEVIQCFVWFFYISTQYKIGDEIVVLDGKWELRGEIIYFNVLNIWLVGRDESGENNGQFYRIPNYKFLTDNIKREDISLHKHKKEEITLMFKKSDFEISFDEFLTKLEEYLEEILPKRTINNVWNFKTFIGYKYKMRFQHHDKDGVQIKISFIARPRNIYNIEKWLFVFVEGLKK